MRHVDTLNLNLCILNTFYPGEPDGYGSSDTIFALICFTDYSCYPCYSTKGTFWRNCAQGKCLCEKLRLNMELLYQL
ncbi:hypothetical protein T07_7135 [Trichinella nelsoni]|uniref:Uncharacterized protein n=1 Tax=Trichinella nelsoni TaxID=6336 RepID=A0A0V0RD48_9BILA|nr:hypothetical protein T07_7135 [Trichinella nelsoni]